MNQSMKEGLLMAVALGLALIAAQGMAGGYKLNGSVTDSVMEVESEIADGLTPSGTDAATEAASVFSVMR